MYLYITCRCVWACGISILDFGLFPQFFRPKIVATGFLFHSNLTGQALVHGHRERGERLWVIRMWHFYASICGDLSDDDPPIGRWGWQWIYPRFFHDRTGCILWYNYQVYSKIWVSEKRARWATQKHQPTKWHFGWVEHPDQGCE